MKRILFVDDEPQLLDGLKVALRGHRKEWRQSFATGGLEALEILKTDPIDILVSDIRMPGMDGTQLMRRVLEEYPHIIRIVLSGYADAESLLRTVNVSHQYLSKPCSCELLAAAIERGCWVHSLMDNEALRKLVGGIRNLPSAPAVYGQLNHLIASDEATPKKIADLLQQDMAMCVKILQMVNSAFFRTAREITSVKEAVVYLGMNTISQLVLSAEIFGSKNQPPQISGWELAEVQKHSMLTATLASRLLHDPGAKSEAFMAGMLQDVGQLILATEASEDFARALSLSDESDLPLEQSEREVFGVDHQAIGGYLMGIWGLPYSTVEAVARHHYHDRVLEDGLDCGAAVYAAQALLREFDQEMQDDASVLGFAEFIETNSLSAQLDHWRELAAETSEQKKVAA